MTLDPSSSGKTLKLVESYRSLNTEWEDFDLLSELKNMVARGEVRPTIYERIFALTVEKNQIDKQQQQARRGGGAGLAAMSSTNSMLSGGGSTRNAASSNEGITPENRRQMSSKFSATDNSRARSAVSPPSSYSSSSAAAAAAGVSSSSTITTSGNAKKSHQLIPEPAAVEGVVFIRHPQYTHHGTHNGVWRQRFCRVCTTKVEWAISDVNATRRGPSGFLAAFDHSSSRRPMMMNSVQFTEDVKVADETSYTKVTGRPNDKNATEVFHIVSGARSGFVGDAQLLEGGRVLLSIALSKTDYPKWHHAVKECLRKFIFSLTSTDEIVHLDRPVRSNSQIIKDMEARIAAAKALRDRQPPTPSPMPAFAMAVASTINAQSSTTSTTGVIPRTTTPPDATVPELPPALNLSLITSPPGATPESLAKESEEAEVRLEKEVARRVSVISQRIASTPRPSDLAGVELTDEQVFGPDTNTQSGEEEDAMETGKKRPSLLFGSTTVPKRVSQSRTPPPLVSPTSSRPGSMAAAAAAAHSSSRPGSMAQSGRSSGVLSPTAAAASTSRRSSAGIFAAPSPRHSQVSASVPIVAVSETTEGRVEEEEEEKEASLRPKTSFIVLDSRREEQQPKRRESESSTSSPPMANVYVTPVASPPTPAEVGEENETQCAQQQVEMGGEEDEALHAELSRCVKSVLTLETRLEMQTLNLSYLENIRIEAAENLEKMKELEDAVAVEAGKFRVEERVAGNTLKTLIQSEAEIVKYVKELELEIAAAGAPVSTATTTTTTKPVVNGQETMKREAASSDSSVGVEYSSALAELLKRDNVVVPPPTSSSSSSSVAGNNNRSSLKSTQSGVDDHNASARGEAAEDAETTRRTAAKKAAEREHAKQQIILTRVRKELERSRAHLADVEELRKGLEQKRLQARLAVSESEDFVAQAAKEADSARATQNDTIKELLRAREEQARVERIMAAGVMGHVAEA